MSSKLIKLGGILSALLVTFSAVGYLLSDNRLASQIVAKQNLRTPEEVFGYVIEHKTQALAGSPNNAQGASFKELFFRQGDWLWCDEGAIVVAVMVGQLGYATRLVDLLDLSDGVSHHTVLQIQQTGGWVTYDFTGRQFGLQVERTVDYPSRPVFREYPTWQQNLLLHNYFLRRLAQKIRQIQVDKTDV
jgi:hypothetical protein